jgi:hypothetical protein
MRPALACLKIVILETVNISASSFAVRARPIRSIRSASDNGSVLLLELHDSIHLLIRICFRGNCRNCAYFYIFIPLYLYGGPIPSCCRQSVDCNLRAMPICLPTSYVIHKSITYPPTLISLYVCSSKVWVKGLYPYPAVFCSVGRITSGFPYLCHSLFGRFTLGQVKPGSDQRLP